MSRFITKYTKYSYMCCRVTSVSDTGERIEKNGSKESDTIPWVQLKVADEMERKVKQVKTKQETLKRTRQEEEKKKKEE